MTGKLAIGVTAALLAAPAAAQDGERVVYRGETSQDRRTVIFATPEGDITKMRQGWRTSKCFTRDGRRSTGKVFGRTKYLDPIEQDGDKLSDGGSYTDPDRDRPNIRYRISGSLEGTFDAATGGEGTATYRIRVRRNGRLIGRCRTGRIEWSVSRVG